MYTTRRRKGLILLGMRTLLYVAADTHLTPHYIRKSARLWDMEVQNTWNKLKKRQSYPSGENKRIPNDLFR